MIERYSLSPLKDIWTDENKFQKMLDVEIAICEAWNKKGVISDKDLENIKNKAKVDIKDIRRREETTRHETVAFVESISAKVGKSGKYIHFGVTSSDILDTAQSIQIIDSLTVILKSAKEFQKILLNKAEEYKHLIMIGRTHGMHAEPITLGFKFLVWYDELDRDIKRIENAIDSISYGKISGSVGTYSHTDPDIEKYVCTKLKLKSAKVSTQILQRDIYCDVIYSATMLGNSLEKIALEIRHLHRTEIDEVKESFAQGQKGSSSMPHKQNPITCERICGQARVLRGYLMISLENTALWHERDMSHSSAERIIMPDSLTLIHFMLNDMSSVITNIVVKEDKIQNNLKIEKEKIFSQSIMLELVLKGMDKDMAYDIVQKASFEKDSPFIDTILKNKEVLKYLTKEEIKELSTYKYYIRNIDSIFKRFETK